MDLKEIQKLIKMVEASEINEIKIEEGDSKIRITKSAPQTVRAELPSYPSIAPAAPAAPVAAAPAAPSAEAAPVVEKSNANLIEVRSPMVGTFYSSPSPDADTFVSVGKTIKAGDVLCIVEAMKLMNEIEAEAGGKIAEICVENAQPVEYNQLLFLVEKA